MSNEDLHPNLSAAERRTRLVEGVALFNSGRYFDSREAFEEVWRSTQPEPRDLLQGLIRIAAGLYHYVERSRPDVARRVLAKGRRRIEPYGRVELGMDVAAIVGHVRAWESWLGEATGAPPREPRIEVVDESALR